MPKAFSNAGYVLATILLIILAVMRYVTSASYGRLKFTTCIISNMHTLMRQNFGKVLAGVVLCS